MFKRNRITFLVWLLLVSAIFSCGSPSTTLDIEEGHKKINGTEIYYKKMGSGEPMLIVHGGPVLDHSYLLPYFRDLGKQYELIFYDQRLSGRSAIVTDTSRITLDTFVEDINMIRREFGLDKMHLLGHSWGGFLSMKYAIKYPQHLHSLVLSNSMPASSDLWMKEESTLAEKISEQDRTEREEIMKTEKFKRGNPEAIEQLLLLSFRNQFYDAKMVDSLDFYITNNYRRRSRLFGNLRDEITSYDLHPELSALEVPTLLIYGKIEPAVELSGERLDTLMPNARMKVIPRAGHFPFIEQRDRYIKALISFLMETGNH